MIDIERLSREKGGMIDREISEVFQGDVPNLQDAVRYHMETGGKRLRPLLAILTYEALGGKTGEILPFAAACEVLHNWFLVHDDIEDGDRVRRNKPAVWVKYGLAHGINVGDYMAQKVYQLILNSRKYGVDDSKVMKLLEAMVETSLKTSEGQALDINMRSAPPSKSLSEQDYMDMVIGKTGHYLTVPMVGAAILAGRNEIIPGLIEFGMSIGPAFQITDDVLDLTDGKGRGEVGRDIKEGKRSILVVHCLGKCSAADREKLLNILNKPPEDTSGSDVLEVKDIFEKSGSIEYAKEMARELRDQAEASIKNLPPELHELLKFFADYLISRRR